jgi:hypothetical protein
MNFNWKFLVPVSIVNVIMMAFLIKLVQELGIAPTAEQASDFVANIPQTLVFLFGNFVLAVLVLNVLRMNFRRERLAEESARNAIVPVGAGD